MMTVLTPIVIVAAAAGGLAALAARRAHSAYGVRARDAAWWTSAGAALVALLAASAWRWRDRAPGRGEPPAAPPPAPLAGNVRGTRRPRAE